MLGVSKYSPEYVAATRKAIDAQVKAYDQVAKPANGAGPALESFEHVFFNNMVLVLDHHFMHRLRTGEGKDGNPMNETRVIANSLMENDGRLLADKQIKLKADTSVLGYEVGDEIKLSKTDFQKLAKGFLAGIEEKFS
jgi:hypothetical protein